MKTRVAVTQNKEQIQQAVDAALAHMPMDALVRDKLVAVKPNETYASREDTTGVTQADTDEMEFPALSLEEAIERFTEAAYGKRLKFEHA